MEGSARQQRTFQSVLNMSQLSKSLQDMVEGISALPERFTHTRSRRASLPAPSTLNPELKRTASHKKFPHLLRLNETRSTPKCFSPKCSHKDKQMHTCHSHCTLPHLPGGHNSKRRQSLPVEYNKPHIIDAVKNRRKSYPFESNEVHELELHRCKAMHKANITIDDIAKEFISLKQKNKNECESLKKVKSEPMIPYKAIPSSLISLAKSSSQSFHGLTPSNVQVHHFDSSKYITSRDSYHHAPSLNIITENMAA